MVIQKLKMDSSVNFENKISYNDFLLRSKRIEEGLNQVLAFMPAMHVLTKRRIIRESRLYLAESETNPNFMTKRNIEEYAENNRILKHVDEMFHTSYSIVARATSYSSRDRSSLNKLDAVTGATVRPIEDSS